MKYLVVDWCSNIMFDGQEFDDFENAWAFIHENISDEETYQDIYVVNKEREVLK